MKRNPPVFDETLDPSVAEECINMMENSFEFVQIEDMEKVNCAMYMLKKDARIWWDAEKNTRDVAIMAWPNSRWSLILSITVRLS